jgi:hypothetical protein
MTDVRARDGSEPCVDTSTVTDTGVLLVTVSVSRSCTAVSLNVYDVFTSRGTAIWVNALPPGMEKGALVPSTSGDTPSSMLACTTPLTAPAANVVDLASSVRFHMPADTPYSGNDGSVSNTNSALPSVTIEATLNVTWAPGVCTRDPTTVGTLVSDTF